MILFKIWWFKINEKEKQRVTKKYCKFQGKTYVKVWKYHFAQTEWEINRLFGSKYI